MQCLRTVSHGCSAERGLSHVGTWNQKPKLFPILNPIHYTRIPTILPVGLTHACLDFRRCICSSVSGTKSTSSRKAKRRWSWRAILSADWSHRRMQRGTSSGVLGRRWPIKVDAGREKGSVGEFLLNAFSGLLATVVVTVNSQACAYTQNGFAVPKPQRACPP